MLRRRDGRNRSSWRKPRRWTVARTSVASVEELRRFPCYRLVARAPGIAGAVPAARSTQARSSFAHAEARGGRLDTLRAAPGRELAQRPATSAPASDDAPRSAQRPSTRRTPAALSTVPSTRPSQPCTCNREDVVAELTFAGATYISSRWRKPKSSAVRSRS